MPEAPIVGPDTRWFRPVPAGLLAADQSESVEWLWHGLAARRHVTLLNGFWKSGKSTLLSHFLAASCNGGEIAGTIAPCRVLVLTEETETIWAHRRDETGIEDNVEFICRPLKAKASTSQWRQLLQQAAQHPADLVVVDTLSYFWPVEDENSAGIVQAALMPFGHLTEKRKAVVMCHHPRKGESSAGQSARGSGALSGYADILLEFRLFDTNRHANPKRKLKGLSRFEETPREAIIELTEDGYRTLEGTHTVSQETQESAVLVILQGETDGLTFDQILKAWPEPRPSKSTLKRIVAACTQKGKCDRTGSGNKNSPFRFKPL